MTAAEAAKQADVMMILLPDEYQGSIYKNEIAPNMKKGVFLGFAHGFNIHYGQIVPPADANVFMVAPKGPGHLVRSEFTKGSGVPMLIAVHQDPSREIEGACNGLRLAAGGGRAGIIEMIFKEETEGRSFWRAGGGSAGAGFRRLSPPGFETLVEGGLLSGDGAFDVPGRDEVYRRPDV